MLLRDIKKVTLEEAYNIYTTMGLALLVENGKIKARIEK